ncbi:hypothetical protein J7643_03585 [bacterium]|nr:hypothetical protein [bacterium]
MSLDPLAPLKALLRQRIRKLIEIERAKAIRAENTPPKETKNDEQSQKTA